MVRIKNNRIRKSILIGGLLCGVSGIAVLGYGYTDKISSEDREQIIEPVEDVQEEEEGVAKTNTNLNNSVESFLNQFSRTKGEEVKTLITENFDSVTGYYAYPAEVKDVGKTVKLNLGLSEVEIPSSKVVGHNGFLEAIAELEVKSNGLAIVKYESSNIESVEIYQLGYEFEEIQHAVLNAKIEVKVDAEEETEDKTYKDLTADDWKGMALLTSREIVNKEMAPIFIVPRTNVELDRDLIGTYYYIIVGAWGGKSSEKLHLKAYDGTKVKVGVDLKDKEVEEGTPVWLHVVTQEGNIKNIEVQEFKEADLKKMSEGVLAHIGTAILEVEEDE